MIDLPVNAEVHCSDGAAGRSTYVIGNPIDHRLTHLVVKSFRPPFREHLAPIELVEETTPDRIRLKCTRNDLYNMEPFESEEFIRTEVPGYLAWPYVHPAPGIVGSYLLPAPGIATDDVVFDVPVKLKNIPQGEKALRRGARVEATDDYVGLVDELLVDSNTMQVTHLVLLERHIFKNREVTIPVSQIERIHENTIYLKLGRQSVGELPTTPIERWPREEIIKARIRNALMFP